MNNVPTIFIGIDFSKAKFDACLLKDQQIMSERSFSNELKGYHELVKWARTTSELGRKFNSSSVLFCGEHTGACSIGLSDYLCSKGYGIWLENALKIKRSANLNHVKTDKADARLIARYARKNYEAGETRLYSPASDDLKKLRELYLCRAQIVHDRVAVQNRVSSGAFSTSTIVKNTMDRQIKQAKVDEKKIEKEIIRLLETSEELSPNYRILTSFKGVGPIIAALFIVYTVNFTKFDDPRKFGCFCGVAPIGEQSGTSVNKKPHANYYAHKEVKAALVQTCEISIVYNPVIHRYAQGLQSRGKHHGVILNNVKNKIIHILFKMIQTQTKWDPNHDLKGEHSDNATAKDNEMNIIGTIPNDDMYKVKSDALRLTAQTNINMSSDMTRLSTAS